MTRLTKAEIRVQHINSGKQIANIFTKAIGLSIDYYFIKYRESLYVV